MSDESKTEAELERLAAEYGAGSDVEGPSTGLLSFYDRLRARIVRFVDRKGSRVGHGVAEALLLLPDLFMLMARLALDKETPGQTRSLIVGAMAYVVLPIDLFPEGVLGVGGFAEDVVLAVVVLSSVLSPELEARASRYWSGSQDLRRVLTDVIGAAESLLGVDLYERVQGYLGRRGIAVDEAMADDTVH